MKKYQLKHRKEATLLALGVMIGIFILLKTTFYQAPLSIFPDNHTYFDFATMTDADLAEGHTKATLIDTDSTLSLTFQLDTSADHPFAMLVFHDLDLVRNYDISPYDSLHFHLTANHSANFSVTLYMYIPGFSNPALTDTHRPYRFDVRLKGGENEITIPLDKFATPSWWFTRYETTEEQLPATDWTKFTHMTIGSYPNECSNDTLTLSFEKIAFIESSSPLFLALFWSIVIATLTFISIALRPSPSKVPTPFSRKISDADKEKLLTYLIDSYTNPLLSLETIKKECGLNHFQVQQILHESFDTSFKEYLITLRLNKAKELLTTTTLPVGVIAEEVGYVYANSFSRTFKQVEGVTPLQFRKQK